MPEADGKIADLEQRRRHAKVFRGSSASRVASPMNTRSDSMTETTKKPDGSENGGLFTLVLRRTSDGWRIVHDHTSVETRS